MGQMVTVSVMQVVDVEVLVQYEVVPEVVYVDVMGQSVTDVLVMTVVVVSYVVVGIGVG